MVQLSFRQQIFIRFQRNKKYPIPTSILREPLNIFEKNFGFCFVIGTYSCPIDVEAIVTYFLHMCFMGPTLYIVGGIHICEHVYWHNINCKYLIFSCFSCFSFSFLLSFRFKGQVDCDFTLVKRGLYYIRNKLLPDSPKTIADIIAAFEQPDVEKTIGSSKHSEDIPFYVGCHEEKNENDDHSYAFCVFKSQHTIDLINKHIPNFEERDILLDATFKCCPFGPFKQLLLLYFRYQDKVFPFAYVLMTRKTQRSYQHLFEYINENVCSLKCNTFTSDYEVAMRNALAILFPGTRLVACWFHYSQALKRKVRQIPNFERFLHGCAAAEAIYYKLQCLPLLPAKYILDTFKQLKEEALAIDKKKFRLFLKYFEHQWIVKVRVHSFNATKCFFSIHLFCSQFIFNFFFYCNQMFILFQCSQMFILFYCNQMFILFFFFFFYAFYR